MPSPRRSTTLFPILARFRSRSGFAKGGRVATPPSPPNHFSNRGGWGPISDTIAYRIVLSVLYRDMLCAIGNGATRNRRFFRRWRHKKTAILSAVAPQETPAASDTPGHPAKSQTQPTLLMSYRTLYADKGRAFGDGRLVTCMVSECRS